MKRLTLILFLSFCVESYAVDYMNCILDELLPNYAKYSAQRYPSGIGNEFSLTEVKAFQAFDKLEHQARFTKALIDGKFPSGKKQRRVLVKMAHLFVNEFGAVDLKRYKAFKEFQNNSRIKVETMSQDDYDKALKANKSSDKTDNDSNSPNNENNPVAQSKEDLEKIFEEELKGIRKEYDAQFEYPDFPSTKEKYNQLPSYEKAAWDIYFDSPPDEQEGALLKAIIRIQFHREKQFQSVKSIKKAREKEKLKKDKD